MHYAAIQNALCSDRDCTMERQEMHYAAMGIALWSIERYTMLRWAVLLQVVMAGERWSRAEGCE